jgi:vacuolar-type H+-ATPase subunit C/Vma6
MPDYDYLNARVRAQATELLPQSFYDQALEARGQEELGELLLETAYRPQLEQALAARHGRAALESGLARNLHLTFSRLRAMAPAGPLRLLNVQFNQWDAANILAVVRGKLGGADAGQILEAMLPVGEFSEPRLEELAAQSGLPAVADTLSTWGYPFAFELRRMLRGQWELRKLAELESAINRLYFQWALAQLGASDPNAAVVRRMVQMQIDLANAKEALDFVRHKVRDEPLEGYQPLAGGLLGRGTLEKIAGSPTMIDAFEALEGTYFAPGIEKGILAYGGAGSLGVMERFLETVVIGAGCRLFRGDPLSVCVPLGFIWRKYNEFLNLRILIRGTSYRMPANAIREELAIA